MPGFPQHLINFGIEKRISLVKKWKCSKFRKWLDRSKKHDGKKTNLSPLLQELLEIYQHKLTLVIRQLRILIKRRSATVNHFLTTKNYTFLDFKLHFCNFILLHLLSNCRGVFKTMSNIYDGTFRSSHPRCYIEKSFIRSFAELTGKHLYQSLFFNKCQNFHFFFLISYNKLKNCINTISFTFMPRLSTSFTSFSSVN